MNWAYLTQPKNASFGQPAEWFINWANAGQLESDSGVNINGYTAHTYSMVWAAGTMISGDVASTPLNSYSRSGNGDREPIYGNAWWVLNEQANELMTADVFREISTGHLLLWGNSYAYIDRNRDGSPRQLIPLMPDVTKPVMIEGQWLYENTDMETGTRTLFMPWQILHVKGYGYDGIRGYSVIALARNSWGLGLAEEKHGAGHFKNGARPDIVIRMPNDPGEEAAKRFLAKWEKRHAGSQNTGRPALATGNMEVQPIPLANNADSEWIASRQFQREEVAAWFRIPPSKLYSDKRTSYNSQEMDERAYVNTTLRTPMKRWESECKAKLLTETQRRNRSQFFEHEKTALIQSDSKTMNEVLEIQRRNEIINANEWRRKINLPVREDEGGDEYVNPNTTSNSREEGDSPAPTENSEQMNHLRKLISNQCQWIVKREVDWVMTATKKQQNFTAWLDMFYSERFPATLSTHLQTLVAYGDTITTCTPAHEVARQICEQNKEAMLKVASYSYPDNLHENVSEVVAEWAEKTPIAIASLVLGGEA